MNEQVILTIAQAILKNTEVLAALVDTLPHEAKQAVAEQVSAGNATVSPAPVTPVSTGAPTPTAPPVVQPTPPAVAQPAVASPSEPVAPVVTPPPVALSGAPFTDQQGMIQYVMASYKQIGPAKGASIQQVLTNLGYGNINDVKPEHYGALYAGIEALK